MIALSLSQLAAATGGEVVVGSDDLIVQGHCDTDSRNIQTGDLFFAKPGEHDDGHRYLADVSNRAAAAFVMQPRSDLTLPQIKVADTVKALSDLASFVLQMQRTRGLKVVGITGSNGKTSTKNMLREILAQVGPTVAPRDSYNNEVGLPLTVLELSEDTDYLVLELGAAGVGSIEKLAKWCKPDIGVELKVGLAHAGAFGGIEQTARIKAELMPFITEAAVLNYDDPVVSDFKTSSDVKRIGFGYSDDAQYQLISASVTLNGTEVTLRYPDGERSRFSLRILGEHQAMNAAAALAVADLLGIDRNVAISAVSGLELAERWRMQPLLRPDGVLVINDAYNASPDSMRAALQTLATLGRQGHRTIAVLGFMAELGEYSNSEHEALGRLVVRYNIDKLYVVGQNAKLIHMSATQEGSWDGESEFYENASAAFEAINAKLAPGDIVLVKSSNVSGLRYLGDELAGIA
ncbi:MAG: UDP-N-acetylmuramoyl-tripeptide--D-alanyl-D-alanine ligase [Actinobacteria bacterium]|nr:UDP-N-acetylmuramoyl-tripeptide--D-alanyl-D-alanine ligase [Actinomycetota bacterium]